MGKASIAPAGATSDDHGEGDGQFDEGDLE